MVAAEKGVADSFGMTLDCQYFSLVITVFCGRCVGIEVWKWSATCLASIPCYISTGELSICFRDDSVKNIRRYVCCA